MPDVRIVEGVKSRAAVAGHPLHPMIVPFPVAMLPAALLTDIVFALTSNAFWAGASFWLLAGGVVTGALAAVLGLIDFASIPRVRAVKDGWIHFLGNAAALVIAIANVLLRFGNVADPIVPLGLGMSAVVALILVVTGWYGGELTYRHGVGVVGPPASRP
ncbi:MAG: DUF2231 domain-containing protein [FCB group bacterium]|jgi:uncharacterized membrane protein|nr:DUF2231 domain-containing protein [FCB group bacterium]